MSEDGLLPTRYGRLRTLGRPDDLIERFLREYGEWAAPEARFVAGAMGEGARVADIGAFLGTFGLGLAGYGRPGALCFVEANGAVLPALRENVARNTAVPATVVEAAIAPAALAGSPTSVEPANAGSFSLQIPPPHAAAASGRESAAPPARRMTLGELWREHGPFDVVKMDVEGLEEAILRDGIDLAAAGGASFWLECSNRAGSLRLLEAVAEAGLDAYYVAFPSMAADNFNGSERVIFPWAYEAGLWATRRGAPPMDPALLAAGCFLRRVPTVAALRQALWDTPRWAPRNWSESGSEATASSATVVARAAHDLLGERFEDFLEQPPPAATGPAWAEAPPLRWAREREGFQAAVAAAEAGQGRAEAAARAAESATRASAVMLSVEREWMEGQCFRFMTEAEAGRRSLADLREHADRLGAERERLSLQLQQIQSSRLFLLMLALRGLALRHPRLHRLLRPILRGAWRLLRRARGR